MRWAGCRFFEIGSSCIEGVRRMIARRPKVHRTMRPEACRILESSNPVKWIIWNSMADWSIANWKTRALEIA